jgi:hypothetical protein
LHRMSKRCARTGRITWVRVTTAIVGRAGGNDLGSAPLQSRATAAVQYCVPATASAG